METSNPAIFVNAKLLPMLINKRVRAVISEPVQNSAGSVVGKSTDGQQIVVKGQPPADLSPFIEVIGIAKDARTIHAEIWTNFGANFDVGSYNTICELANGEYKQMFS